VTAASSGCAAPVSVAMSGEAKTISNIPARLRSRRAAANGRKRQPMIRFARPLLLIAA